MSNPKHSSLNLLAIAHKAMVDEGFEPDFPVNTNQELQLATNKQKNLVASSDIKDLTNLLWSSIDNNDSKDLDQLEYVERQSNGNLKLMVAIADVDEYVNKGSNIDIHAQKNTTSVYTGIEIYPMLPLGLSTNLTSLLENQLRLAIVVEMTLTNNGDVVSAQVYRAMVNNHAKLAYEAVGNWLEGTAPPPPKVTTVDNLSDQLKLQAEITDLLRKLRQQAGALRLETIEAQAIISEGQILDLAAIEHNQAQDLIENFMITANTAVANFLESKNTPSIRRVVKKPERWPRIVELASTLGQQLPSEPDSKALSLFLTQQKKIDPEHFPDLSLTIVKLLGPGEYIVQIPGQTTEGHFGLAVHDYTHATAPNRRYADLIMQRLLKAVLSNQNSPYSVDELIEIAANCTQREDASRKVERFMRKVVAAVLLKDRIGEVFKAIVTGAAEKGVYVRLLKPPAEGRVIKGEKGLDVGDTIRVRLVSTNPSQGYIDFARA